MIFRCLYLRFLLRIEITFFRLYRVMKNLSLVLMFVKPEGFTNIKTKLMLFITRYNLKIVILIFNFQSSINFEFSNLT